MNLGGRFLFKHCWARLTLILNINLQLKNYAKQRQRAINLLQWHGSMIITMAIKLWACFGKESTRWSQPVFIFCFHTACTICNQYLFEEEKNAHFEKTKTLVDHVIHSSLSIHSSRIKKSWEDSFFPTNAGKPERQVQGGGVILLLFIGIL